jgi:hypothetical protein
MPRRSPSRPSAAAGQGTMGAPTGVERERSLPVPWNRDPRQGPRPPVHHHPPRGNAHGLRPSAPGSVGRRMRRARSAPLRVGAAVGPPAPPGDRADSDMGARRDHDVPVPLGGRPCHGSGESVERSSSSRSIRGRPGRGGGTCRRTRAGCCGLRDQGCSCGRPRRRDRERRTARVPLAARTASGRDRRTGSGRSAVAQRDLLVGVRLLTGLGRCHAHAHGALRPGLVSHR